MMDKRLYRKAGFFDLILVIILSFILVVVLVLFTFAQNTVEDQMLEIAPTLQESFGDNVNVTVVIQNTIGETSNSFDNFKWISVTLIFGFLMSVLVSAFLVRTHPAWFVGYIFIVVVSVIISVYVSNTYEVLMANELLASTFLTGFYSASWIFLHLPIWISIIGFVAGILMFTNLDQGGYYG